MTFVLCFISSTNKFHFLVIVSKNYVFSGCKNKNCVKNEIRRVISQQR